MRRRLLLLALAAGFSLPATAQTLYLLDPGDPVRVTSGDRTYTGELVSLTADSLRLSERVRSGDVLGRVERAVALSDVDVAFVRRARSRQDGALRGALIGGAVPGAVTVVWLGVLLATGPHPSEDMVTLGPLGTGLVAVTAAAVGAGIGALTPGGWWDATDGVRIEAASSGLGVRVTF